jgi:ketosteroid isomerase-like protein
MRIRTIAVAALALMLPGCASAGGPADPGTLREQVMDTERAFARTMAERDHDAFTRYLSDEAVFFEGETPTSGKDAIAEKWKPFFDGDTAPFAWQPDHVEVLKSGTLALTSGPVYDAGGRVVGRFNSVWRQEAPGEWRVVFDKGSPVCPPQAVPEE